MFKFTNESDPNDPSFCTVEINVKEKTISGREYFEIEYAYTFEGKEESRRFVQPLYMSDDADGVIVVKNAMTEIMVNYLLKEPEELVKVSGTSTAQHYRTIIMESLNQMWD